jgi:RimJ/RimL family protein N-acetyltransferase
MYASNPLVSLHEQGLLLEQAGWPMSHLSARLPELIEASGELHGADRLFWLSGLRRAWKAQGWAMSAASGRDLLALATTWRDLPLVLEVGANLEQRDELDANAALGLMAARHALGEGESARDLAWRWQLLAPRDRRFADAHRELANWLEWRAGLPRIERDDLRLEPLGHQHLEDFAWQYHAPDIRELCRMPEFRETGQWHAWLDGLYGLGDELPLAILQVDQGFVGCVHLVRAGEIGFLYYWLGADFRGQGLATRAVSLLLEAAARMGLVTCYAKVFEYNAPSRRMLERLGFVGLGIHAAPPDVAELFYRLGDPAPRRRVVGELHELMARMRSDTLVAAPLQSAIS